MSETTPQGPPDPPPTPSVAPEAPVTTPAEPAGRYDANVQLILRRLADHQRTFKPRRWWQGG